MTLNNLIIIMPFGILLVGAFIIWLRVQYYDRQFLHIKLRVALGKDIAKIAKKIKKEYDLTEKQISLFNFLVETYKSKNLVRALFFSSLFINKKNEDKKELKIESELGIKESDKLFSDMMIFMVLCFLHASTYNFFLGGIFRQLILPDVVESPKRADAAAEHKSFIKRPDVLYALGDSFKTA